MSLELADRSIQYLRGIAENVLIKIDKFVLPIDFVILNMQEDSRVLIILGRSFLATARAMIDVFNKMIALRVRNEEELLEDDQIDSFLVNNLEECIDQSDLESCGKAVNDSDFEISIRRIEQVNTPYSESLETQGPERTQNEHLYSASAKEIDKKRLELKDLPSHLEYVYLKGNESWSNRLEDVRHKWNKSVILHTQDLNGGKLQTCHSTPAAFKSERFFQIPITPEDQEKKTVTCPYGTFAYRRMPFGLCKTLPNNFCKEMHDGNFMICWKTLWKS
ncbi:reverse transcriptase domain-containing protein [Tanacetum coccineum]